MSRNNKGTEYEVQKMNVADASFNSDPPTEGRNARMYEYFFHSISNLCNTVDHGTSGKERTFWPNLITHSTIYFKKMYIIHIYIVLSFN